MSPAQHQQDSTSAAPSTDSKKHTPSSPPCLDNMEPRCSQRRPHIESAIGAYDSTQLIFTFSIPLLGRDKVPLGSVGYGRGFEDWARLVFRSSLLLCPHSSFIYRSCHSHSLLVNILLTRGLFIRNSKISSSSMSLLLSITQGKFPSLSISVLLPVIRPEISGVDTLIFFYLFQCPIHQF